MSILVTGGAGYIRSIAVEQLVNHGHRPIVIDSLQAAIHSEVVFYQGSLGDIPTLIAIFGEPQYTPVDEAHPQNPVDAYGETKSNIFYENSAIRKGIRVV